MMGTACLQMIKDLGIRLVRYMLPVSDFELRKADESREEAMARRSCSAAFDVPLPKGYQGPQYRCDGDLCR